MVLKGPRILFCGGTLRTLSPDSSCQLDVFWHDGDSPGVDSTQIGIFKQADKVRLRCLLKTQERCCLEPQACLDILCDLPHYPLERQLSDEQRRTALVMTDVFQSHSSCPVPVGLYSPPLHPCLVDLPLLLIRPVQHTMAQLSSLLGTRDVEGWQLPINRRVSHDLLSGLLTCHRWFWLLVPISSLPSFVGIVIVTITVTTSLLASGTACTTCTRAAALLCTAPVTSTSTAASCWLLSRLAPAGASCTTRGLPGYSGPVCQFNALLFRGVFVAVDFGHWNLLSMLFLEVGDELLIWSVLQPRLVKAFCRARVSP